MHHEQKACKANKPRHHADRYVNKTIWIEKAEEVLLRGLLHSKIWRQGSQHMVLHYGWQCGDITVRTSIRGTRDHNHAPEEQSETGMKNLRTGIRDQKKVPKNISRSRHTKRL